MKSRSSRIVREEKRRKRNSLIMGSILVFLMVFSLAAYGISQNNESANSFEYNGFKFQAENVQGGVLLFTNINGQKIGFYTDPLASQNVADSDFAGLSLRRVSSVVFSKEPVSGFDVAYNQVYYDAMIFDFQRFSQKNVLMGVTKEEVFNPVPVYTCEDATLTTMVFILSQGPFEVETPEIVKLDENCYGVRADMYQIFIVRDYLLYKLLGVLE